MSDNVSSLSKFSTISQQQLEEPSLEEAKAQAREKAVSAVAMQAIKHLLQGIVSHAQEPFDQQASHLRPAELLTAFNEMSERHKLLAAQVVPIVVGYLQSATFQNVLQTLLVLQENTDQKFMTEAVLCSLQPQLQGLRQRLDEIAAALTVDAIA